MTQIYINLTIAIIVDAFTGAIATDNLPVRYDLLDEFVKNWSKLDPDATGFIKIEDMDTLLIHLCNSNKCINLFKHKDADFYTERFT